jgi:hypothetical protein
MNSIVYIITNLTSGKKYIGSDSNNNKYYYGSGVNIKKAIKKYGKKNFKKDILWEGDNIHMREMEEYYCEYYNVKQSSLFYNCTNKGVGSIKGIPHPGQWKVIIQWDINGGFIKEWNSLTEAQESTEINNIGRCLRGTQKSAGGYLWTYKNSPPISYSDNRYNQTSRRLHQYDSEWNFIREWKSAWEASKFLKTDSANIRNAILKNIKAKGYYFKYVN